jgi:hypothetical protein
LACGGRGCKGTNLRVVSPRKATEPGFGYLFAGQPRKDLKTIHGKAIDAK